MKDYDFEIKELGDNSFELILLNTWNKETLNKNIQALNKLDIKKNSQYIGAYKTSWIHNDNIEAPTKIKKPTLWIEL